MKSKGDKILNKKEFNNNLIKRDSILSFNKKGIQSYNCNKTHGNSIKFYYYSIVNPLDAFLNLKENKNSKG